MKKINILLGVCLILSQSLTCAQKDEQVELFLSPFQFTFINICDSIDGVPVGFINVVRTNGYRDFVFSLSETQYANIILYYGCQEIV